MDSSSNDRITYAVYLHPDTAGDHDYTLYTTTPSLRQAKSDACTLIKRKFSPERYEKHVEALKEEQKELIPTTVGFYQASVFEVATGVSLGVPNKLTPNTVMKRTRGCVFTFGMRLSKEGRGKDLWNAPFEHFLVQDIR